MLASLNVSSWTAAFSRSRSDIIVAAMLMVLRRCGRVALVWCRLYAIGWHSRKPGHGVSLRCPATPCCRSDRRRCHLCWIDRKLHKFTSTRTNVLCIRRRAPRCVQTAPWTVSRGAPRFRESVASCPAKIQRLSGSEHRPSASSE
jgi:hypothetical protein